MPAAQYAVFAARAAARCARRSPSSPLRATLSQQTLRERTTLILQTLHPHLHCSPAFVLPVPRGPGAFENFVLQCQLPRVLFTSLEDWKRHGPAAAPHFTTTYYRELMDSKGLVLVRGDITQPDALTCQQASDLMRNAHDFYCDARRHELVHAFNHRQAAFDFQRVLEALELNSAE